MPIKLFSWDHASLKRLSHPAAISLVARCVLFLGATSLSALAQPAGCSIQLPEARKQSLLGYVRKKFVLPDSVVLRLSRVEPAARTCYQRLVFQITSALGERDLALFLSPDGRYLATDLFDTEVDPVQELQRNNQDLLNGSTPGKAPTMGNPGAPVTIAIFSDFQCPFCRKFAKVLAEVLPYEKDRVRVVFHHLPLAGHAWARSAAEGTACAAFQSDAAFWAIHDQLFRDQQSLTADSIKEDLVQYAHATPHLDFEAFRSCLNNEQSLGIVLQDINLALSYDVHSTPTVFVNGRQISTIRDAGELRKVIQSADTERQAGLIPTVPDRSGVSRNKHE
jgi:protein-disulfide isomerase